MALKLSVVTRHGITLPEAYIRINQIVVDNRTVSYTVRTFADKASRQADKESLDEKGYSFSYKQTQGNAIVECYNNLKALPEFTGSVDV